MTEDSIPVGRTGESTRQEDERGAVRDGGALTKDSANESCQRDHTTTSALGRPQASTTIARGSVAG